MGRRDGLVDGWVGGWAKRRASSEGTQPGDPQPQLLRNRSKRPLGKLSYRIKLAELCPEWFREDANLFTLPRGTPPHSHGFGISQVAAFAAAHHDLLTR